MNTTTNTIDSIDNCLDMTNSEELTIEELWQIDRTGKNEALNDFVARLNANLDDSGLELDLVCDHVNYAHDCDGRQDCAIDYDTRAEDCDVINYLRNYGGRQVGYMGKYEQERAYQVTLESGDVCWIRYNAEEFSCLDYIIDNYDFPRREGKASYWWHIEARDTYKHYQGGKVYGEYDAVSKEECVKYLANLGKSGAEICELVGDYQDEDGAWWIMGNDVLCCDPKTATKMEERINDGDDCMSFFYSHGTIYQAPEGHYFEIGEGQCGSKWAELEEGSNNSWVGGSGCLLVDR